MADHCHYIAAGQSLHSTVEVQKAWHLFTILLQIGRPTSVEELAATCVLFSATPDFVQYLCSIPNSPICLADNGLVLISMVAMSAVGRYVSKTMDGWGFLRRDYGLLEQNRFWGSDVKTYFRKRKRSFLDAGVSFAANNMLTLVPGNGVGDKSCLSLTRRFSGRIAEVPDDYVNIINSNSLGVDFSFGKFEMGYSEGKKDEVPMCLDYGDFPSVLMNYAAPMEADNDVQINENVNKDDTGPHENRLGLLEVQNEWILPNTRHADQGMSYNLDLCLGPPCSSTYPVLHEKILDKSNVLANKSPNASELYPEDGMHTNVRPLEVGNGICESHLSDSLGQKLEYGEHEMCRIKKSTEYSRTRASFLVHSEANAATGEAERNFLGLRSPVNISKDEISMKEETQTANLLPDQLFNQQQLAKTIGKHNGAHKRTLSPEKTLMESVVNRQVFKLQKQQNQCNNVHKLMSKVQKFKKHLNENVHIRVNVNPLDSTTASPKLEKTALPQFESFIIEEAEGSGGYGTVYRARRKNDGKRIAIKCPHVNAHKHNVNNEQKMLETFGGRNFIIKYEGSFRSGDSECLVLEHVEHDRPEVLKKEIDLVQLQWYGYCLFRALSFLHRQGVMHRDVKPGNFLFSRKLSKGYLIDFNLAMDLHQKYFIASQSNSSHHASLDHVPVPPSTHSSTVKDKKNFRGDFFTLNKGGTGKSKQIYEHDKNSKKRTYIGPIHPDRGGSNVIHCQGADGSGITSGKDVTSARTQSTENTREPLPCQGRKELVNLAQSVLLSTGHVSSNSSVLRRKRVAAPPGKADSKVVCPSPMLAHRSGVAGSRILKNKGDGKRKREGSCAGTKGFRAPEVLFRSLHQGPQVDVWSAGVTFLYLMVGRCPFTGDPEQNIKDIAKLRGSEDLWEVAKLHDRETAFPAELLQIGSFPAVDLRSWCKAHTKRPEFLKLIPTSLFDLVDKCLTVNPRLRITAEEALKHEFFNWCHERLMKQRMFRQGSTLNSSNIQSEAAAPAPGQSTLI